VLVELVAKHRSLTHFEVLSIPTDASPAAIKSAYFKLAKDFHPDTVPPEAPEVLAKAKADVFARIGEAHRVLTDPNLRAEYLLELQSGGPDKVDVSMILQAEELFQKGKLLIQARKYPEAIKMFDEVITITPDDAEVYSWRGYAKFFTFQDRKQGLVEAMKDVTHCLKRNANVVAAFYHQGMMNKICGDIAAAKKHFQQAVRMDSKHLEAQRELRALK
jgi:curved DNA-binding protein CbpA